MFDKADQENSRSAAPVVHVVEDDPSYGAWLVEVLKSVDLDVRLYSRPSDLLEAFSADELGCIILDVRLPEMSGLDLHKILLERGVLMPVMMITGYGEVADAVESIRTGAVDYIQKPTSAQALLERVQRALQVSLDQQKDNQDLSLVQECFQSLSPRENQVLELLLEGKSTKQVSATLGIGLTTVDYHRHNILDKMRVENVVELAHVMDRYKQLRPSQED